jgi:outer membrane protein assembly factor BamA
MLLTLPAAAQKGTGSHPGKEGKRVNTAAIPIVTYNRSFGMQFGAMVNLYYDLNKRDTVSPASSTSFFGSIFTNKTFFTGLFNRFHFGEDRWRLKSAIGYGNIRFQTFVEYPEGLPQVWAADSSGLFIDYSTQLAFIYGEISRQVAGDLYMGVRLTYSYVNTEFEAALVPDEVLNLFGMGLVLEYDHRDNVFSPTKGFHARARNFSFYKKLGSSNTYHRVNFEANKYFQLGERSTLLARLYGAFTVGDSIPFNGKNVVGRDDLRGYTDGRYRANQVYDLQSEYRRTLRGRWGMVAFAGVALATDDRHGNNYSGLLPAAGAGLRFKMIPSRNINIGIDGALGKNDWGIYFRIGEAFTK